MALRRLPQGFEAVASPAVAPLCGTVIGVDDPVEVWRTRQRGVPLASWLYDIGVLGFSWRESRVRGRGHLLYAALLARDGAAIAMTSKGAYRRAVFGTILANLFVARRLRRYRAVEELLHDRPLSQVGVSPAQSLAFFRPQTRSATAITLAIAQQLGFIAVWRPSGKEALAYLGREALWTTATMEAIRHLRRTLREAIDSGLAATEDLAEQRLAAQEARFVADRVLHAHSSERGIKILGSIRYKLAALCLVTDDDDEASVLVDTLAEAEGDRLRNPTMSATTTVDVILARLSVARPLSYGRTSLVWTGPGGLLVRRQDNELADWLSGLPRYVRGDLAVSAYLVKDEVELILQGDLSSVPRWTCPNEASALLNDRRLRVSLRIEGRG